MSRKEENPTKMRYVALGDSYTIGEGAAHHEAWPVLLTQHLQQMSIEIELVANPSVTGWTTQDLINNELDIYDSSNPDFATLLIGVNDWVQEKDSEFFQNNLAYILDRMQHKLPNSQNLILITIPDFSATPNGKKYAKGRDISQGIDNFNKIIAQEAAKRGIPVVDIYPLTQQMLRGEGLVSEDGLHPSAKEYSLWEELIYSVAYQILK